MREQWCYAAIAAVLGIAAEMSHFSVWWICLAGIYAVYCMFFLYRRTAVIAIAVLFAAILYAFYIERANVPPKEQTDAPLQAVLMDAPQIDGDRMVGWIETKQQEKLRLLYTISSEDEQKSLRRLQAGMTCTFTGKREAPEHARNFQAFDYAQYLHREGVHALFRASEFSACSLKEATPSQWLFALRQKAVSYVGDTFTGDTAGFISALLYGDRQDMSEKTETSYQQLGLVHLLAISGSHISLLTAACYYLFLRCGLTREMTTMLLFIVVPVYMFLAGASPSVVRAAVAAVVILFFTLIRRRISGLDAISITGLLMLMQDPYVLYDIGFQFSFLSAIFLLLSARQIISVQYSVLRNLLYVAAVAQLAALPVTLYHFGQLSPYSIILNLLYVPFLSFIIMPLCFAALLFTLVLPPLGTAVAQLLTFLLDISNALLQLCEQLPFHSITFGLAPGWLTFLYSVLLIWLLVEWEQRTKRLKTVCAICVSVLLGHYMFVYVNPTGSVTFLDVGQGDCIIVQLPYGKGTYMIDTGGTLTFPRKNWQKRKHTYSVGSDTVLPYLRSAGIKTIDKLIITHGDQDHMGAAAEVLAGIPVREVLLGAKRTYAALEKQVSGTARKTGTRVTLIQSGMEWRAGDSLFTVLAPTGQEEEGNDASVVLRASIGGLTWLFTGDVEENGEKRLIQQGSATPVDVLKIGHHGSKTSTSKEWLNALQPRYAVISAGSKNRYGHPHQEVLDRLAVQETIVYRTDRDGAVAYVFRGKQGTFRRALTYDESTRGGGGAKK